MTDAEISKALAIAIGWTPEQIRPDGDAVAVHAAQPWPGLDWPTFDYRNTDVIWPIAEQYNSFPIRSEDGSWSVCTGVDYADTYFADTAAKAVAIAVIEQEKQK